MVHMVEVDTISKTVRVEIRRNSTEVVVSMVSGCGYSSGRCEYGL